MAILMLSYMFVNLMSLSLKTTKKHYTIIEMMYPTNAFKLGSFVQLVPNVSSSKNNSIWLGKNA